MNESGASETSEEMVLVNAAIGHLNKIAVIHIGILLQLLMLLSLQCNSLELKTNSNSLYNRCNEKKQRENLHKSRSPD